MDPKSGDQDSEPTIPEGQEREPEGGPRRREEEFLDERTRPIRPKGAPPPAAPRGGGRPMDVPGREGEELPEADDEKRPELIEERVGPDFRRRLIDEYRRRQKGTRRDAGPHAARPGAIGAAPGGPPMPPVAPPANNWIPIGPSVVRQGQGGAKPATSGRTTAIAVAPGGNTVYVGAANGGVWRSDDAGVTWRSLMDAFDLNPTTPASDSLSIGALAVDPSNPARLFVGSGEGDGAAYFGVGPIVTTNGTTAAPAWSTEVSAPGSPSLAGSAFYRLTVDPNNTDRVLAATYLGLYRREPGGVGFRWARKTLGGVAAQRVTSVVSATSGGTTTFYAAVQSGLVYSSTDGNTWVVAGAGFPAGTGRISLATRRDDPTVVYALSEDGTVRRLSAADGTWRSVTGVPASFLGTQGWYDIAIAVAPDSANRIYLGGSTVLSGGDWSGSLYRCEVTVVGTTVSMTSTYIGGSIHADVHTIAFAPGDASKMWVGCDGGVFYSTNPTGPGSSFVSRNTGLQTLTMEYLAQHPTEDAVLFGGTQDNGCLRFTGEEAWLYSAGGDGGYEVVNWNDPYRALSTYVYGSVRRTTNGGQRYAWADSSVALAGGEAVLFYAPLAGTPPNPGSSTASADADLVGFGSIRPWISTDFGTSWQSIPNGTLAGDSLDSEIRCLSFASATRLYAGTVGGGVYRFDRTAAGWTRTQIDTLGGANQLPLSAPITDIAVNPSNVGQVWVTLGGSGDWRHVWFFDGTQWAARSGPAAGNVNSLLDVFAGALVPDPLNANHLYLGADIGAWRSTDGGQNWATYSDGLPDAGVTDLVLHAQRGVIRAATHGRGVWERTIPDSVKQGVELYVRSTELDMGRRPVVNGLPDPTTPGDVVRFWRAPDIRVDTPDVNGQYQFPLSGTIDFLQFDDTLTDDFRNVATHATANIITRVYVQIHNRGVVRADSVRVMLLLANASAGLPALPAGYDTNVRNGLPINTPDWRTVGIATINDVRAGFPQIAAFNLPSTMLPPPANLAGNQHQCLLALVHHPNDQFTSTQVIVDPLSRDDRKAAHKNLTVVQFTGTLPPAMPLVIPFRITNPGAKARRVRVRIGLGKYPGRVRVLTAKLSVLGKESFVGFRAGKIDDSLMTWAKGQLETIARDQAGKRRWDEAWAKERLADIHDAIDGGQLLEVLPEAGEHVEIRDVPLEAKAHSEIFLVFDRPSRAKRPIAYPIEITQHDARGRVLMGGLTARVEVVTMAEPSTNGHRPRSRSRAVVGTRGS